MADSSYPATTSDDDWPLWARSLMTLAAAALCAGGVVAALYAKETSSLVLGLVAAAVGVLWLAQVPGPGPDARTH